MKNPTGGIPDLNEIAELYIFELIFVTIHWIYITAMVDVSILKIKATILPKVVRVSILDIAFIRENVLCSFCGL